MTPPGGADIQTFNLANAICEAAQTNATDVDVILLRKEENANRRGILARQVLHLVFEVLERKIHTQGRCVLFNELPSLAPVILGFGNNQATSHYQETSSAQVQRRAAPRTRRCNQ